MPYTKHTKINGVYVTKLPERTSWQNMINRCLPAHTERHLYFDRGITVCDEWLGVNGFLNFYKDMGDKPSSTYTLDRIDNDKGYSKDNCRWATKSEQALNRRLGSRNTSGYRGVCWQKVYCKWVAVITDSKNKTTITLGRFDDKQLAALAYDAAAIQLNGHNAHLNLLEYK